jgi:hypothetical protein
MHSALQYNTVQHSGELSVVRGAQRGKSPAPLNIYWPQALADDFAKFQVELAERGPRLSNSKLGEIAVRDFLNKYSEDLKQLVLDLGLK